MKNPLPLMLLFIPQITFPQDYPGLLANSGWCCEQFFGTGAIYSEYYVSGDTVINEQSYVVINDAFYLQEDTVSGKVWYLNHGEKELLYDFSLELSDTFRVMLYDTIVGTYVVTKADTLETLAGCRKRWHMQLSDSVTTAEGRLENGLIWIEGVGSTYGPIYPVTIPFDNDFGGAGTCLEGVYSKDKVQIYQGYCTYIGGYHPEYCRFISSVKDMKLNSAAAHFSASGSLQVNSSLHIERIYVFDLCGRRLYDSGYSSGGRSVRISNNWPAGIYLCTIISGNNETHTLKLVKGIRMP